MIKRFSKVQNMESQSAGQWSDFLYRSLPDSGYITLQDLYGDGSRRRFFRVEGAARPAVLMVNPDPPCHAQSGVNENDTYVYIAGVLREAGGLPPEVIAYDREKGLVLLEDLGDRHLQSEVLARGPESDWTRDVYRRLIELLVTLQVDCAERFEPSRSFNPRYDSDFMYQAEGLYFTEYFVERLCGIKKRGLKKDLRRLARFAGSLIGCEVLLYRDFQSRNIMLGEGGEFRLLDFQGARLGPPAYDPASLIYDPYIRLTDLMREELISYYSRTLAKRLPSAAEEFERQFPFIAAHRLMQVLGAYGKLSLIDGKSYFLQYVPQAFLDLMKLLQSDLFSPYPAFCEAVFTIHQENLNSLTGGNISDIALT